MKPNLDIQLWDSNQANAVVTAWQRNFTNHLYNHVWNKQIDNLPVNRQVHPLASTSIADMLEEFSQFQFLQIGIGYLLMVS